MAKKKQWEIIHDMDDEETGEPTGWSLEINHEKHGKYVWITLNEKGKYNVEVDCYYGTMLDDFKVLAECNSLSSAKRWVTMNLL